MRYLDLLAFEPIEIDLSHLPEVQLVEFCSIRIPQPALYVAQKVLSRSSGRASHPEKAAKDLAYIYDVALLCEPLWPAQAELLGRAARNAQEWRAWLARAGRELRVLFSESTAEGPVETVRIYRDVIGAAAPTEDEVQRLVMQFAGEVFRIGR